MRDRVIHDDHPPTLATVANVIYTIRAGQVILSDTVKADWAWSASILAARMTLAQFWIWALMRVEIPPAWSRSGRRKFSEQSRLHRQRNDPGDLAMKKQTGLGRERPASSPSISG
jgi:hypothetical protein